jgi:hypothetical protein
MMELSPLEYLKQEYTNLNDEWRANTNERRGLINNMDSTIKNGEAARMSPSIAGFLGAASGFLQPETAFGGALKARQAQAMLRDKAALGAAPDMNDFLQDSGKQLSDLQRSVLGRLTAKETESANRFYVAGNANDGLLGYDKQTGKATLLSIPAAYAKTFLDEKQKYRQILIDGGVTDAATLDRESDKRAKDTVAKYMGMHQFGTAERDGFESPVKIPGATLGSTPAMERTPIAATPGPGTEVTLPLGASPESIKTTEAAIIQMKQKGMKDPEILAEVARMNNVPQTPVDVSRPIAAAVGQPSVDLKSAQQKETEKKLGEGYAVENTADRQSLTDLRQMEQSLGVMQKIMDSGVNTSGQAHELVNKFGGYLNYIDPNGSLAKAAGNDAVYFSNMMNLVRDKIAALGSGTAISNLDLIVTQKSVGDLRNTPEGNKKLMAIMELQNATMQSKLSGKLDYFDNTKSYDKYRGNGDPTHLVRASRLPSGETRYWVQTREGWIDERVQRGDYKTRESAERAFTNAATQATASLIKGTGITFNRGQK